MIGSDVYLYRERLMAELPAAGEQQARKRKPAKAQHQLLKTRRVPAVQCTLC